MAAETRKTQQTLIGIDDAHLLLAPYVWKRSGNGAAARAEAALPGAYVKARFQGSSTIELIVDGTANRGCPASSMPVVEYSIDEGAFQVVPLTRTDRVYTLPLADGLIAGKPHRIEVYFRAADLTKNRWKGSTAHLRIAGLALDAGGSLLPCPARPGKAIGFGDSITEGVGADGLFTSWQLLGVNNARGTWLPIVCGALNCEYGQLGSGGQGMTRTIHLPPLPATWDRYDPTTSRLTGGMLLPEPDYVFCCMGTNDFDKDITADYTGWLAAMRRACPHTQFFCVVPPLGVHQSEIAAAVAARNQAGDRRVHLIDTAPLKAAFRSGQGATQLAHDGVHPSEYGHALLGALIAVEVIKQREQ
jgi:lysophospholipase L1-like esterase